MLLIGVVFLVDLLLGLTGFSLVDPRAGVYFSQNFFYYIIRLIQNKFYFYGVIYLFQSKN